MSEQLTRLGTVGKTEINKVYDPACGSGSPLLKAEKVLGREAIREAFNKIKRYQRDSFWAWDY